MIHDTLLLIALLFCHYIADFCLTMSIMIKAKADGRNLWPILLHASVHVLLMGLCLLIWGVAWKLLLLMMLVEFVSHFCIDTGKARLSFHFPHLADSRHKPYWMLYGFDQLLHQLVIVLIWFCSINNDDCI